MVTNENARISHLLRVDGVENSPNYFDLDPVILTLDLDGQTQIHTHTEGHYQKYCLFC